MKKNQKRDQAFLFEQIDKKGDLGFDYTDIKDRVNILQYEKKSAVKAPPYRLRPQVLTVACSLILVTAALGFGGFMMSQRGSVTEPDTTTYEESIPVTESQPAHQPVIFYPEDVLLWQGDVYIRTSQVVVAEAVGEQLGQIVSETASGSPHMGRDDPHIAISDHLADGTPFHQVSGKENYIAVSCEEGYIIYQKQHNPDTTTP